MIEIEKECTVSRLASGDNEYGRVAIQDEKLAHLVRRKVKCKLIVFED